MVVKTANYIKKSTIESYDKKLFRYFIAWSTIQTNIHTVGISSKSYSDAVSLAMKGTSLNTQIVPINNGEKMSRLMVGKFLDYLDTIERKNHIRFDIRNGKNVPNFSTS